MKLVSGSKDSIAIIWNLQTGIILFTLRSNVDYIQTQINCIAISNDNTKVVVG